MEHIWERLSLYPSAEVWLKAEGCLGAWRGDQSISADPFKLPFRTLSVKDRVCLVSAGGRMGLLENVTEEVQSLKTKVELLEKVPEKRASQLSPVPDVGSVALRPEVAAGAGPVHQRLPAVVGRRLLGEDHLPVPLLPAAGSHRLPQRADRLSGGAPGHM